MSRTQANFLLLFASLIWGTAFVTQKTGILANAMTTEATRGGATFTGAYTIVAIIIQVAVYVIIAMLVSLELALASLIVGIVIMLVLGNFISMSRNAAQKNSESFDRLQRLLTDVLNGIKPLKAMSVEDRVGPLLQEEAISINKSVKPKEVDAAVANDVEKTFATGEVKNRDGRPVDWLKYNFEGFPMVASITKLTQMQADVKTTESKVLSALLAGQQASELSFSNYEAIVVPDKTAFFSGETFKGRVVLGRFDATLKPTKVEVNGKEQTKVENGQIMLEFPAGNVGEQDVKGELQFKEGDSTVTIPIKSSYAVIPKPNSAVIAADKMNVVYRGVSNPMTISIPGLSRPFKKAMIPPPRPPAAPDPGTSCISEPRSRFVM